MRRESAVSAVMALAMGAMLVSVPLTGRQAAAGEAAASVAPAVKVTVSIIGGPLVSPPNTIYAQATISSGGAVQGTVTWSTSDSSVAAVTPDSALVGKVKAVKAGTAIITATYGSASGSAKVVVLPPAVFSKIDDPEPVFNATKQTLLLKDDFDGYRTFDDAVKGGWLGSNGRTTADINPARGAPSTSQQIISGGHDGAGKAIRLTYFGTDRTKQESFSWVHRINDPQAGMPGHAFYISYYFRITPPGEGGTLFLKWLMLWNHVGRAQFSTHYQHGGRYGGEKYGMKGGPMWNFLGNSACNTANWATQIRPPYAIDGFGQWHRATHKYVSQSGTGGPQPVAWNPGVAPAHAGTGVGNRDGVAQMWYDGTLIVSVGKNYCGLAVPGGAPIGYVNPPHWCEEEDLDAMYVNAGVSHFVFGGPVMTPVTRFSIDYDQVMVWRD